MKRKTASSEVPGRLAFAGHFDRWVKLAEEAVRDLCPPGQAGALLVRARTMRTG
jgi:hypothetical protein